MCRNIFSVLLLLLLEMNLGFAQDKPLKFVIRVDDILSRNVSITPRSILPFQDTVEARGGKITWGVMPHRFLEQANEDGQLAEELKLSAERGHEISQHGFEHVCKLCGRSSHEMYCTTYNTPFSYQEQEKLVIDGIKLLQEYTGTTPVSFIPPGHISDETTFEVLSDSGFEFISTTREKTYLTASLYNLPPDGEFTWALTEDNYDDNLIDALADIKQTAETSEVYNLFLHDPFIRSGYGNGITLSWMGELMDSLRSHFGEYIEFTTLSEAAILERGEPVSNEHIERPYELNLFQNYPNPFNPTTQIRFGIPQSADVQLNVYNMLGQQVAALVSGQKSAGWHTATFDASGLSSGAYIYRIQAGEFVQTKKLILIK